MSIPPEALLSAAHYLEDHDEGQRIKKLLFCLCKKYWENDPNVLNSHPLDVLLPELVQLKPTIEQLTFSLYKLVKTLNRPKVYAAVAKTILDQLGPVYTVHADRPVTVEGALDDPLTEQDTQLEAPSLAPPPPTPSPGDTTMMVDPSQDAALIAQTLTRHPEQGRIKKLVFAVARGYWENNLLAIDEVGLDRLLLELRQRYPTPRDLQGGFEQIVNNINKAALYLAIAKGIMMQMNRLYANLDATLLADVEDTPTQAPALPAPSHLQTSIVDLQALPLPPPPPGGRNRQTDPIVTVLGAAVPPPPLALQAQPKSYNLFDLRCEIMQYTNPLRAKILLFSVLFQSWDDNGQDWGMIRSYALDDLIEQLILSRKRPNDVEVKLNAQADQMAEQEAYQQTAQTLIKILKPLL